MNVCVRGLQDTGNSDTGKYWQLWYRQISTNIFILSVVTSEEKWCRNWTKMKLCSVHVLSTCVSLNIKINIL